MSEKQEPVACVNGCSKFFKYTHPQPKREWVGLTDEERNQILVDAIPNNYNDKKIVEAIEAKLKEKNT